MQLGQFNLWNRRLVFSKANCNFELMGLFPFPQIKKRCEMKNGEENCGNDSTIYFKRFYGKKYRILRKSL
jgi:hypothetical protein